MKVYDIALMLIRALVALDLIRESQGIVTVIVRGTFVVATSTNARYLVPLELGDLIGPVFGPVVSLVILVFSRSIVRFAAKFAGSVDAASQFS